MCSVCTHTHIYIYTHIVYRIYWYIYIYIYVCIKCICIYVCIQHQAKTFLDLEMNDTSVHTKQKILSLINILYVCTRQHYHTLKCALKYVYAQIVHEEAPQLRTFS